MHSWLERTRPAAYQRTSIRRQRSSSAGFSQTKTLNYLGLKGVCPSVVTLTMWFSQVPQISKNWNRRLRSEEYLWSSLLMGVRWECRKLLHFYHIIWQRFIITHRCSSYPPKNLSLFWLTDPYHSTIAVFLIWKFMLKNHQKLITQPLGIRIMVSCKAPVGCVCVVCG